MVIYAAHRFHFWFRIWSSSCHLNTTCAICILSATAPCTALSYRCRPGAYQNEHNQHNTLKPSEFTQHTTATAHRIRLLMISVTARLVSVYCHIRSLLLALLRAFTLSILRQTPVTISVKSPIITPLFSLVNTNCFLGWLTLAFYTPPHKAKVFFSLTSRKAERSFESKHCMYIL